MALKGTDDLLAYPPNGRLRIVSTWGWWGTDIAMYAYGALCCCSNARYISSHAALTSSKSVALPSRSPASILAFPLQNHALAHCDRVV